MSDSVYLLLGAIIFIEAHLIGSFSKMDHDIAQQKQEPLTEAQKATLKALGAVEVIQDNSQY